jgi:hypothetical protein
MIRRTQRTLVAGGAALLVVGAAVAGAADAQARSGSRASSNTDLVVTLVTPTTNQEILSDFSDPGLNGGITVRFSAPLRRGDFISRGNGINSLTPAVEFLNSQFQRLPGEPQVHGNTFKFDPTTSANGGALPDGQYTLNIKSSVRSIRGKLLNQGLKDFTTCFSVGVDKWAPVLRSISPLRNQQNIGLNQKIVMSFNEPINAATLITTITVNDVSTNPPTPILGPLGGTGVTTDRGGFDVVFTPDPCFGYPPKSTIEITVQGAQLPPTPPGFPPITPPYCAAPTAVSAVTDVFNNNFTMDQGIQWSWNASTKLFESPLGTYDCAGAFKTQFVTRGIVPPPVGLVPGSPQWINPFCGIVLTWWSNRCDFQGRVFYYSTGTGIGQIDITQVILLFALQGVQDFTLSTIVPNSPVRTGRPGGMITDPRWDAGNGNHTFLYIVDQRSATVLVVDSRNMKTLGRFAGFSSPRDVGMSTDFGAARVTLWVTDFGAKQVVGIDLASIAVNLGGQPGAQSPCDAIKDNQNNRVFLPTGNGPTDVSADSFLLNRVMVVNSLSNSVTLIDAARGKVLKDYQVGGNPLSCDFTLWGFGALDVAAICNQGGLADPSGSVSMYLRAPPLQNFLPALAQQRDDIEATLTDQVKNPTYVWGNQEWASPATGNSVPQVFFVPNTGGKTILDLRINVTGTFGLLIDLQANQVREVGFNPTGVMYDAYFPNQFIFSCVAGEGKFAGMDSLRNLPPQTITVPGIRRIFTCFSH